MSLFQCRECGCRENTACCLFWTSQFANGGRNLCSACDPRINRWHGNFPRMFLPKGEFKTNAQGNLEHKATGRTDLEIFEIKNMVNENENFENLH